MPELPEVETIVRACRERLDGHRITGFGSSWPRNTSPTVTKVRRAIVGRTITHLTRRAKFIVFQLDDGGSLLVHLRMSGRLEWAADDNGRARHVRAHWNLDDGGRLLLCDARKFARILHTRDLAAATTGLGTEPLERSFTAARLSGILRQRRRQLKPLLLDQSVIAGLGNIYADEALYRAALHPATRSDQLTDDDLHRLHAAIRDVLREAIRHGGTSFDWVYAGGGMQRRLRVYGRTGEPCGRCGTPIEALRVAQRGTHICPCCQRQGKRRRTVRRRART